MKVLALVLASLFFGAGLLGTILPVLPGAPLIWAGMFLYGLLTGFTRLPWTFFLAQGIAVLFTFIIDYLASLWGTRHFGGSRVAIWGAFLGALVGGIVSGPLGIILGPFAGAIGGELLVRGNPAQALKVGLGTILGLLGGTALKFLIEAIMIIWFFLTIF